MQAVGSLRICNYDNLHVVTGQNAVKFTFTVVRNSDVDRSAVALLLRNSGVAHCSHIHNNVTVPFPGS